MQILHILSTYVAIVLSTFLRSFDIILILQATPTYEFHSLPSYDRLNFVNVINLANLTHTFLSDGISQH